jgi:hypothetical protein
MFKNIGTATLVFLMASLVASTPVAKLDDTVTKRSVTVRAIQANKACGVHVREGKGPQWPIEAEVFAPETEGHQLIASGGGDAGFGNVDIDPHRQGWLLVITKNANEDGDDTLRFGFGNDIWNNNDGRCSVGRYDGGWRQMDCSFSC